MFKLSKILVVIAVLALAIVGCQKEPTSPVIDSKAAGAIGAVTSATLHVFGGGNSATISIYRITAPWDELTVTWNSFAGAYDAAVWQTFAVGALGWHTVDITSLVQAWEAGTYPNYGLLLDQPALSIRTEILSSESINALQHPFVVLCDGVTCDTMYLTLDTYINENEPNTNFGVAPWISIGNILNTIKEKQGLIQFTVESRPPQDGCSHTIGYWKTHAGLGHGNQADVVTQYLPIWLGTPAGAKSRLVSTNVQAVQYLNQKTFGSPKNGITKLYAQLLGAKLSIADGADDADVAAIITAADAFLATHNYLDWDDLTMEERALVMNWHADLDSYNNGLLGPGHCDEESTTILNSTLLSAE